MRVTVLGAGNGGHALAAALGLRGHQVTVFSRNAQTVEDLRRAGAAIRITGVLGDHRVPLAKVSGDIADAVAGCDLAVLTVPGSIQEGYLRLVLPHLASPQALWMSPGNGASLLAWRIRAEQGGDPILLIETATLAYVGRRTGPATVHSRAKARTHMATFPAVRNPEGLEIIEECCDVIQAANVLETTLMNINCVIHPLPALLNWGWIESREGRISLYGEGMSPGVIAAIDRLDAERHAVATKLGLNAVRLDDIYRAWEIPPLYRMKMTIGAAERYEERFILEDVPVGLVTVADLGGVFGVPTPMADAAIALAGAIYGRDFRIEGRTVESLGIGGMDRQRLLRFLETGPA